MKDETYWLKASAIPGAQWQRVSLEDWIKAERNAGFRPKIGDGPATGGWSNSAGISGAVRRGDEVPTH